MIIALIEHDRGRLQDLSLQMLTMGHRLAGELEVPLHAVLVGEAARPIADRLGSYGVSTVDLAQGDSLDDYAPEAWAQSVVELMDALHPEIVMAAGTDRGHEVMAHVAARTDLALAANCTEIRPGDPFELTRVRWGGSLLEEARLTGPIKLLTIVPHAVAAQEVAEPTTPKVESFSPTITANDLRVRVVGRVESDRSKISLSDARVVVGGGRGVGSGEGFQLLEELASLLGGTVECSRAVTSLGWRPHTDQVGQTGTRIAPDVYIACGISGAIQHMVGCKSAKCLVAINKDPEAPIVSQADYAIIGDLQEVLPALRDAIRTAKTTQ
ncbi:MAG: electron transfer flavoprotein subunit alpha [Chloroflexota bacterium]